MVMLASAKNLLEFFRGEVSSALQNQKLEASQEAEFYLVNLLNEFTKTENLYTASANNTPVEEPLALMLGRAVEAPPATRNMILKKIGDISLYIAGFFEESLARKLVDITYYVNMGGSAYHSLSALHSATGPMGQLFDELAHKFVPFTDILSEVSDKTHFHSDSNLLLLYEKWLRTGSIRSKDLLCAEGLIPVPTATKFIQ